MSSEELGDVIQKAYVAALVKFYQYALFVRGGDVSVDSLDSFLEYGAERPGGQTAQAASIFRDLIKGDDEAEWKARIVADTQELEAGSKIGSDPTASTPKSTGCLGIVALFAVASMTIATGLLTMVV